MLRSSDFSWTLAATDEADPRHLRLSLWGRGDLATFAGRPEPGSGYEGQTWTGWLGGDVRSGPWVAGAAIGYAVSGAVYDSGVAGGDRRMRAGVSFEASATGLHVQVYGERSESLGTVPDHALALSVQLRY